MKVTKRKIENVEFTPFVLEIQFDSLEEVEEFRDDLGKASWANSSDEAYGVLNRVIQDEYGRR